MSLSLIRLWSSLVSLNCWFFVSEEEAFSRDTDDSAFFSGFTGDAETAFLLEREGSMILPISIFLSCRCKEGWEAAELASCASSDCS